MQGVEFLLTCFSGKFLVVLFVKGPVVSMPIVRVMACRALL